MFQPLQTDIESRFATTELFFKATKAFKGDLGAAAKGLAFVQIYAIYEFTVCSVVRISIDAINAHKHRVRDISPSLMALFLDSELNSLRDCSRKKVWDGRLKVFDRAFSRGVAALPNTTETPHDGSHFRHSQLTTIFNVFGISRLPVRRRSHLFRINEVVDNRNKIAHGAETAEQIGRRYTREDIARATSQMKSVCFLLISIFEEFCADRARHLR